MSDNAALIARRERLLGRNMSLFYDDPVHLVRGEGVWLWDADGRRYLDCYNNVPHVGHCHPRVVEAITRQASTLNTHTRYLHEGILDYVERLTATFDSSLDAAILTCTGSEANDVALRMAQAVTGRTGVIATNHTYHGNTAAVSQLSTRMPPVGGFGGHVRHVPAPDSYRPLGGEAFAAAFAAAVEAAIASLQESPHGFSALIIDPFFANEGFPDLPRGFLDKAVAAVRKAGGLVITDEVQPGFGRTGSDMWGHQRAGIVPDIVTLGKPMANGHPVGGVVANADVLNAFRKAFRYFNTFGGNPVSCAAAMAVLDVIEDEKLVENARDVGEYTRDAFKSLAQKHTIIGDVRGSGLFMGMEFVADRATKEPAVAEASRIVNEMRERGVLMGKIGIHQCATKIRPPMPFSRENADLMLSVFDDVLSGL
ncbi:aspartate aminotransferase family protein [Rhizobium redzepovicii]|uniref:Aspartate aminotransferase family protein n=1 Tax=Rhizobium redzepovicii TaxID=2867518 RepID=A0AAW8P6B1_9HYPH|nr:MULTISPECIES: aspartate aminotransferase family protein [Rhizobium]MBB3525669.1 4-aminobutyrate aminotransferase-like enzyme [Rhizobium sp. BK456]MDF0661960.1 aspartate aminotransferase family protein [Rhizobium sp. BC49]MDR9762055.1 aspartate aminotransferase family protein [Rhizobium redzepovicii]PDS84942.1 aspartate aminotransferase family protein [Rhizobium sp. L18]TBY46407.1 aspartate aminotransferase family protein [Rhizobium leguminosarum bv. viciae]